MDKLVVKDALKFDDNLNLSEYRGYTKEEIKSLHKGDEVVKIVVKSNKNVQIYFKRKPKKEEIPAWMKKTTKKKVAKKKQSAS